MKKKGQLSCGYDTMSLHPYCKVPYAQQRVPPIGVGGIPTIKKDDSRSRDGGDWWGRMGGVPASLSPRMFVTHLRGVAQIGVREGVTQYKGGFSIGEMGVLFGSFGRCLITHTRG